jgi:hypothetical protein
MARDWSNFFLAAAGAAAALTGLLFVAVALRPGEIRRSPLMVGRARAAFYAFSTVLFTALLALSGSASRWLGLAVACVPVAVVAASSRFTAAAIRARALNYRRAFVYHAALTVVAVAGAMWAIGGAGRDPAAVLAIGMLGLLAVALSNSWQLVITHEPERPDASA